MNVGELRKALEGQPDDAEVFARCRRELDCHDIFSIKKADRIDDCDESDQELVSDGLATDADVVIELDKV